MMARNFSGHFARGKAKRSLPSYENTVSLSGGGIEAIAHPHDEGVEKLADVVHIESKGINIVNPFRRMVSSIFEPPQVGFRCYVRRILDGEFEVHDEEPGRRKFRMGGYQQVPRADILFKLPLIRGDENIRDASHKVRDALFVHESDTLTRRGSGRVFPLKGYALTSTSCLPIINTKLGDISINLTS